MDEVVVCLRLTETTITMTTHPLSVERGRKHPHLLAVDQGPQDDIIYL